jgi:carboxyl-terminal processing protease
MRFASLSKLSQLAGIMLTLLVLGATARAQTDVSNGSYGDDFNFYWQTIDDNFAYFDAERPRARWRAVRGIYAPLAAKVTSKDGLIRLLEHANNELYNGHLTLNVNLKSSNRIIPTGADMWAEPERGEFVIRNVRAGYNADRAGIRPGMVVVAVDGRPCERAIRAFLPRSTTQYSRAMREYASVTSRSTSLPISSMSQPGRRSTSRGSMDRSATSRSRIRLEIPRSSQRSIEPSNSSEIHVDSSST